MNKVLTIREMDYSIGYATYAESQNSAYLEAVIRQAFMETWQMDEKKATDMAHDETALSNLRHGGKGVFGDVYIVELTILSDGVSEVDLNVACDGEEDD